MTKNQSMQSISQTYVAKVAKVYAGDRLVSSVQTVTATMQIKREVGGPVLSEVLNLCTDFEK